MIVEIAFPVPLHKTFYYRVPQELMNARIEKGMRAMTEFGRRKETGVITAVLVQDGPGIENIGIKTIESLVDAEPLFKDDIVELAYWISGNWGSAIGLVLSAFFTPVKNFSAEPLVPHNADNGFPPSIPAEEKAFKKITDFFDEGERVSVLLTKPGAGKTGLYSNLIRHFSARSGQVMCLVRDAAALNAFREAFSHLFARESVGLWHSGMTAKQKKLAWTGVRNGTVKIIIALRSGVFLPFNNLKLVIAEDEQDRLHVQEEPEPRFNARDVLIKRADFYKAAVVLASPCPSIESYWTAKTGTWNLVETGPAGDSTNNPPEVSLIDMYGYPSKAVSDPLAAKLQKVFENGKKAVLLTSKKGYSAAAFCAKCGHRMNCPGCGISLYVDKNEEGKIILVCGKCGKKYNLPENCPRCSGKIFRHSGAGVKKLEEELKDAFKNAKILRTEADEARKTGKVKNRVGDLTGADFDILITSRFFLKELKIPGLALIGLIDADSMLYSTDFSSSEQVFQTLLECYGLLAGRDDFKTEFVIQTRQPDYYVFSYFPDIDYKKFADFEIETRKKFVYPPFSRILEIALSAGDKKIMNVFFESMFGKILEIKERPGSGITDVFETDARSKFKKPAGLRRIVLKISRGQPVKDIIYELRKIEKPRSAKIEFMAKGSPW
ncbi:MAG: primosomal protein N' [Elusimicrobia bacterium]|nr:primosomal protein N' [Elusimicrobiota bacterium]